MTFNCQHRTCPNKHGENKRVCGEWREHNFFWSRMGTCRSENSFSSFSLNVSFERLFKIQVAIPETDSIDVGLGPRICILSKTPGDPDICEFGTHSETLITRTFKETNVCVCIPPRPPNTQKALPDPMNPVL